jgi:hypothetical protein
VNLIPFPTERRARDEAVKLAKLYHYGPIFTVQLIRAAVRQARALLPADAARVVVKAPDAPVGAA